MAYRVLSAVDAAYGTSLRADRTAIVTGALDLDALPAIKVHLLDAWWDRIPLEAIPAAIERQYRKWRPISVGIENTLWQVSLIRAMRALGRVPFYEIDRRKQKSPDKKTRAGSLAFHYSEKHLWHPDPRPAWLDDFEAELLAFTGEPGRDDHDDLVDAWVDVVDGLVLGYAPEMGEPTAADFTYDDDQERNPDSEELWDALSGNATLRVALQERRRSRDARLVG